MYFKFAGILFVTLIITCPYDASATNYQVNLDSTLNPSSIAKGDLNGDLISDFVIASRNSSGITVFFSDIQTGTYLKRSIGTSSTLFVTDIQIFDRNNDGDQDIIVSQSGSTDFLYEYSNLGGGIFSVSPLIIGRGIYNSETLSVADFNKDNKIEIVVTGTHNQLASGGLVPISKFAVARKADSNYQYFNSFASLSFYDYLSSADVGDIDGDSFIDFVASSHQAGGDYEGEAGDVVVWFNSNGLLDQSPTILENIPKVSQIKIADVTGDGIGEIIVASINSGILIFKYNGNHTFNTPVTVPLTEGTQAIAVDDFNNDGRNEILLSKQDGTKITVITLDYVNQQFYETSRSSIEDAKLASFSSLSSLDRGSDVDITSLDYDFNNSKEVLVPGTKISSGASQLFVFELSPIYLVETNVAPIFNLTNQLINEAQLFTYNTTATDLDGDILTYGVSNLPAGASYDTNTGVLSWTPGNNSAGVYSDIVFTVTDNGIPILSDSETISITVTNVNQVPELNVIAAQTISEANNLTFTLNANDPDNDPLTYSSTNLPVGATLNPATGEFSWTPNYSDAGTYVVVFSVSDGELSTTTSTTIEVLNTNRAPVLESIGNQITSENQTLSFTINASDEDNDTLTYSAINLPSGATFNPTTATFSWTPAFNQSGNYENIEFTVTDNGSPMELDVELITITVGDVNRAPEFISPGTQEVLENNQLQFTVSASDPDNDTVTVSATNLPNGATFNATTLQFSWTPTLAQEGIYTVSFTALDTGTPIEASTIDVVITVGDNPTPVEQAEDIINTVTTFNLPTNVENSYMANLQKVGTFIEAGNTQAALNQLTAFINKVNQDYNQNKITLQVKNTLVSLAEGLIGNLQ